MTTREHDLNMCSLLNYKSRKQKLCIVLHRQHTFCNLLIPFYYSHVDLGALVVCFYLSEVDAAAVI